MKNRLTKIAFKWVKITVAILLVLLSTILFSCSKIIFGPNLKPTESDISLTNVFPEASNKDQAKIESAREFMDEAGTTATIIIKDGKVLAEWGETDKVTSVHSVRKSIVSALYGIAVEKGLIDIQSTLESLNINDVNPTLNAEERQATLEHFLTSSTGIYHPSVKDDNGEQPPRGTHKPGEVFFYNNWSFNAVGTIFEQLTGLKLGEAFDEWIAKPTGMQDFSVEDVRYTEGKESVFPAYRFWMSTRDLARFGMLYIRGGKWDNVQVIPEEWIEQSLARQDEDDPKVLYGYMWWTMPSGVHMATGTGGQKIWIDKQKDLLIVNKVNTGKGLSRSLWWTMGKRVNNSHMRGLSTRLFPD